MRHLRRVLVVGSLLLISCGSAVTTGTTPTTVTPTTVTPTTVTPTTVTSTTVTPTTVPAQQEAIAYFVRDEHLLAVRRTIPVWEGEPLMAALLAGPTAAEQAKGVHSLIPAGTVVRGVEVADNTATVDLNAAFEAIGGALAVQLSVAQVVYTLTQLPNVDVIRFEIDGEPRDMLSGEGLMVDHATREQFHSILPGIFLEAPLDGDRWADPITIAGTSDTFEATVNYQVLDGVGKVVQEGVTTATCGSGCVGVFMKELDPMPAGTKAPLTLRVFDYSSMDGTTKVDLVEITLT